MFNLASTIPPDERYQRDGRTINQTVSLRQFADPVVPALCYTAFDAERGAALTKRHRSQHCFF